MRYDGPVSKGDEALAIKVDGYGNVYVAGYEYGSYYKDDFDYAIIKYRQQKTPYVPFHLLLLD